MAIIIITGTPGTGKTDLAKLIEKELGFRRIDVNKLIEEQNLCEDYDEARQCKIIDSDKLSAALITIITESKKKKEKLVIDSHLAHRLPKKYVDLCIVTKCDLKTLKQRLEARNYSEQKVRENLDAEIFDNCLTEAVEVGHKILIIDTSHISHEEELLEKIKERIK